MSIVKSLGTLAGCTLLLLTTGACGDKHDDAYTAAKAKPSSYDADTPARDASAANPNADNTARNAEPGATALDQGNSEADLGTTQKIRQAVMDEADLSTTAKNVKIITRDGKVTLRGPVNASIEKTRIEEIAVRVAGAGNVMNEIELVAPRG